MILEKRQLSERGKLLSPIYGIHFLINSKGLFYVQQPIYRIDSSYHGLCCTNRRTLAGTRNSSMGDRSDSGATESLFWGSKGGSDFHLGWGQKDGIAMKGAQSKVKLGGGGNGVNEGPCPHPPPPQAPRSYATAIRRPIAPRRTRYDGASSRS